MRRKLIFDKVQFYKIISINCTFANHEFVLEIVNKKCGIAKIHLIEKKFF